MIVVYPPHVPTMLDGGHLFCAPPLWVLKCKPMEMCDVAPACTRTLLAQRSDIVPTAHGLTGFTVRDTIFRFDLATTDTVRQCALAS